MYRHENASCFAAEVGVERARGGAHGNGNVSLSGWTVNGRGAE